MLALSIVRLFGLAHLICAGAETPNSSGPKASSRRTSCDVASLIPAYGDVAHRCPLLSLRMACGRGTICVIGASA